jgi:hypothetical protein
MPETAFFFVGNAFFHLLYQISFVVFETIVIALQADIMM